MIKWIVFDAMGVIFEEGDDIDKLLIPFLRKKEYKISEELLQEKYLLASLGRLTAKEFWSLIGLGNEYPEIEKEYLDTCLVINPKFKDIVMELSTKYSIAILSNDIKEWSGYLRQRFGLDKVSKISVISGDVGFRKPSKDIYEILLNKLGVSPNLSVFIDDRLKNLIPAKELGMEVIWLTKEQMAQKEVKLVIKDLEELPAIIDRINLRS